jgi:hypothetical protein
VLQEFDRFFATTGLVWSGLELIAICRLVYRSRAVVCACRYRFFFFARPFGDSFCTYDKRTHTHTHGYITHHRIQQHCLLLCRPMRDTVRLCCWIDSNCVFSRLRSFNALLHFYTSTLLHTTHVHIHMVISHIIISSYTTTLPSPVPSYAGRCQAVRLDRFELCFFVTTLSRCLDA